VAKPILAFNHSVLSIAYLVNGLARVMSSVTTVVSLFRDCLTGACSRKPCQGSRASEPAQKGYGTGWETISDPVRRLC
jgi:hypothetical protein